MGFGGKKAIVLEKLVSISLADLRGLKFFDKVERYRTMPVTIKKNLGLGIASYSMQVAVSIQVGNEYVEFDFGIGDRSVKQRIPLAKELNHLTNQFTFYFKCSITHKRCRKLFFYDDKWVSREAITNWYYLRNTLSKKKRRQFDKFKRLHTWEQTVSLSTKKNFTPKRKGQVTIRMKKVIAAKEKIKDLTDKMG